MEQRGRSWRNHWAADRQASLECMVIKSSCVFYFTQLESAPFEGSIQIYVNQNANVKNMYHGISKR